MIWWWRHLQMYYCSFAILIAAVIVRSCVAPLRCAAAERYLEQWQKVKERPGGGGAARIVDSETLGSEFFAARAFKNRQPNRDPITSRRRAKRRAKRGAKRRAKRRAKHSELPSVLPYFCPRVPLDNCDMCPFLAPQFLPHVGPHGHKGKTEGT